MKREIELVGTDVKLQISRLTVIDVVRTLFHLDELEDGTWRVTITKSLAGDLTGLQHIEIADNGSRLRSILDFVGLGFRMPIKKIYCANTRAGQRGMIHFQDSGRGVMECIIIVPGLTSTQLAGISTFKINRED